jgi:hypothetical protein
VGLISKYSARHMVDKYSKAYLVRSLQTILGFEVPKRVMELDRRLGFDFFPNCELKLLDS